jgi:hypothetical protein
MPYIFTCRTWMRIVGSENIFSQQETGVKRPVRSAAAYIYAYKRDVLENITTLKITLY